MKSVRQLMKCLTAIILLLNAVVAYNGRGLRCYIAGAHAQTIITDVTISRHVLEHKSRCYYSL
jgi:hypothetical protein